MNKQEEQGFSNEFVLTRLAAGIIKANLNKSPIEIGNLIVRAFHSQGVVIKVDRELPEALKLPEGHSIPAVLMVSLKEAGCVAVEPILIKEATSG